MKNKTIFKFFMATSWLLLTQITYAQVDGLSYTLSPTGEYVRWDDKAGLQDGLLVGGKVGFGFGEFLELRGTYMQGLNLKTDFKDFGLANYADSSFIARDVKLHRWGGELKANFSRGKLLPYITLGTGIQSIALDTFATQKQIYATAGLGLNLSVGDRYTFNIEAKNTRYNFNAGKGLLTPQDKIDYGATDDDFQSNRLNNWSLSAALQFYLGGRRPSQLSELDKAFSPDGLKGLRVPLEPTLMRMNFHESLPYRDTWMAGGYTGFDFSPYIGVRGFYFQAMEDNKISTNFDKLAMYGGELRAKLTAGMGLTPYLTVGGGYINAYSSYEPKDSIAATGQPFGLGGVGIDLPLSKKLKITGGVRAMLTTPNDIQDLEQTEGIATSFAYNLGVNFTIGKKAPSADSLFQMQLDSSVTSQRVAQDAKAAQFKTKYQTKLADLEAQLDRAYAKQDLNKAAKLLKEKEVVEEIIAELESREGKTAANPKTSNTGTNAGSSTTIYTGTQATGNNSQINMSAGEFENLIEEILQNMGSKEGQLSSAVEQQLLNDNTEKVALEQKELEKRLRTIEETLIKINEQTNAKKEISELEKKAEKEAISKELEEFSAKLLAKIEENSKEIKTLKKGAVTEENNTKTNQSTSTEPTDKKEDKATSTKTDEEDEEENLVVLPKTSITKNNKVKTGGAYLPDSTSKFSNFIYEGMSGFAGFNLGGQTTANVGFRWHYGIENMPFELMPEAFFGFGSPSSFGLQLNGIVPVPLKNSVVTPYVGTGGGFMKIAEEGEDRLRLNYNLILGTYLNVFKGRLYVDVTSRNTFKFNQITAGYRFPF